MAASGITAVSLALSSRFLRGIAPADLRVILAAATPRNYLAGSVIVNQGLPADHLFLLARGRCRYFFITREGRKLLLMWHPPGEIFGGAALLSAPSLYLVSSEAVCDSRLLVWDRATIRRLAGRFPRLLENSLLMAADYLAWYLATHVALVSETARERLAHVIVCLAASIGRKTQGGVEIDATNEELASAANITPFTASRLLSEWQRSRAVKKRRGKILLCSPEKLSLRIL